MLKKFKFALWLIIILVVAYFVSMNSEPKVSIKIFFGYQTIPLPLSLIIIGSAILGALLILLLAINDWLLFKMEKIKLSKRISELENRLKKCEQEKEKLSIELDVLKSDIKNDLNSPKGSDEKSI